jgi:hypothetical protein
MILQREFGMKKLPFSALIMGLFLVLIALAACDSVGDGGDLDTTDPLHGLDTVLAGLIDRVGPIQVGDDGKFIGDPEGVNMQQIATFQDVYDTAKAWCSSPYVPGIYAALYVNMKSLLMVIDEVNKNRTSYRDTAYATEQAVDQEAVTELIRRLWLPEKLFVVLSGGNAISYSTDASVWHTAGSTVSSPTYRDIAYGAGKFVVVENNFGKSSPIYSSDGHNWSVDPDSNVGMSAVAYGNDRFVGVDDRSYHGHFSTDGVSWQSATIPEGGDHAQFSKLIDITYGDGKFVALQSSGNNTAITTDGIDWEWKGVMPAAEYWSSIVYSDDKFIAVGGGGKIAVSTDGIDWVEALADASLDLVDLVYGAEKFIALSGGGKIITSTDGIDWTASVVLEDVQGWDSIAYGNDKFVAVAGHYTEEGKTIYSSRIAVSIDGGVNWKLIKPPENRDYAHIMYVEDIGN